MKKSLFRSTVAAIIAIAGAGTTAAGANLAPVAVDDQFYVNRSDYFLRNVVARTGPVAATLNCASGADTPAILVNGLYTGTNSSEVACGVMRGLGDSASALRFLLVSTVVNTVLDYVFVAKFGMGVPGVAWATVIAQLVSAILALYKVMRLKDVFELKLHHLLPGRRYFGTLIRLGLPSGVTQAIFSMSMIVVQSLTNSFGEMFIAANVIVMRIDGFVMMPAFSLGTAMTTFAGQNIGAGLMDRVVKGARNGTLAAMGISAVITALILLFGRGLMGVFTTTQELIDLSFRMMKILAPGYIAMEVTQCLSGIMRGAGDTVTPMWISIFNTILVRVPLAYGLVALSKTPELPQGNCAMMYVSLLITWIIGAALTYILYRTGRWKRKAAVVLEATEN